MVNTKKVVKLFLTNADVYLLQGVAVGFVLLRVEAAVEDE